MKERKKLVTEETVIEINEDVFKIKAENLICKRFIAYVNGHFDSPVIELKL